MYIYKMLIERPIFHASFLHAHACTMFFYFLFSTLISKYYYSYFIIIVINIVSEVRQLFQTCHFKTFFLSLVHLST